ncbi:MAG: Methylmalonyl-CoA carboxyltransferase 12S subunit [Owenweeksia sp. TMED14]|mgnify:CR=1 FL=1|nr:MAG: Methylmalonyl-CoA carboxyltransferase 12S subunit [Owenweeksia sp. TMED14]|tara:strand:+ start:15228 stop:16805 length:1578 start_codon:yes stop_codon:yes gene_type:complete
MKTLITETSRRLEIIYKGGGEKKIEKIHSQGKLTARERVKLLLDPKSDHIEIGAFAADGMYADHGGAPAAGVVVIMGKVKGRICLIVANDASVKAGAWFPMSAKKNLRAQEIAMENRLPILYLVDSAGVYLPLQDEIFPDKEHFGRIFRNNAVMSSKGIPQISAVMGSCVAGGAYLPIMSDESIIVEGTGSIFLAGSYLVKAAIGEDIDNESLGGAKAHAEISGVIDYKVKTDDEAISLMRSLVDKLGDTSKAGFNRENPINPLSADKLYERMPIDAQQYSMHSLLECIIDADSLVEYKKDYGKTLITAYARIDGWSVGIVANDRKIVKNAKGEMQIGGVIYSESADKGARFIANCNQKNIPLVFFQDVTGFMVGSKAEHGGIIKDGAKLVNAVANSVVPKFTIIVGHSFGAGNYAMCGKAYDPRLIVAWPTAKIAVMGGDQAAKVLLQIEKSRSKGITQDEEKNLLNAIHDKYDDQMSPYYAASRLWVDAVIDPKDTRSLISTGIEASNNSPIERAYNPGVLQT